jgi:D-alanyl-D-alanine endopeptidase (penicillin-binding protein 7)
VDHLINWVWQGCLVALVAMAALGLMERTRAQARYVVCWLALIAVTLLPVLPPGLGATSAAPETTVAGAAVRVLEVPAAWWSSATVAMAALGAWFVFSLFRIAAAVRAARRLRAGSTPFPSDVEAELRCWISVRDAGRRSRLVLSPGVRAAAVVGCGHPVIAVAPALLTRLGTEEIDRVIVHEWAHVQRRDDLANVALGTIRAMAGWHPAVWWLERRMLIEREVACDETAVAVTGCPKRYAASLTAVAALPSSAAEPLGAMGVLSTPALTRRVVRILSTRTLASRASSAGAAALAVAILTGVALVLTGYRVVRAAGLDDRMVVSSQLPAGDSRVDQIGDGRPQTTVLMASSDGTDRREGIRQAAPKPSIAAAGAASQIVPDAQPAVSTPGPAPHQSGPGTPDVALPALVLLASPSRLPIIDSTPLQAAT